MAQKVQALDLGSWSVKRVEAKVPLVGFGVAAAVEEAVPSATEPKTRRADQWKAVRELVAGKRLVGAQVTVTMPAERILNRVVELPFSDRGKIGQVLGFELENHVPYSADDVVYDYIVQEKGRQGSKLFVSVAPKKEMEEMKENFVSMGMDPRIVGHQAMANARLYELLTEPAAGTVAFIDMGHRKTLVSLAGPGGFLGARVILHGGYDLTRALAEQFSLTIADAEKEKHSAHLYPAGQGTAVGLVQETADCLKENLKPLVRDLHQAFKALGAPDEVYVFGGGAKLQGIDTLLAEALGVPTAVLFPSMLKVSFGKQTESLQYVSGIAQAYNSQRGADYQRINLRQGKFAYEGDFKFMRGRLIYLATAVVVLLGLLAAPQWMKYRSFEAQEELLRTQLSELSSTLLGEELEDWEEILAALEEMPPSEVWTVFPDLTAHEVFWEVMDIVGKIEGVPTGEAAMPDVATLPGVDSALGNAALPVSPVHHLEMNQIRIEGTSRTSAGEGMVEFTGNASSVATMEMFLSTVGKHPCFHNVQRTKQEMLKATPGKEGWWRFTVEFTISCPKKSVEELKKEKATEEGAKKEGEAGKEGAAGSEEQVPGGPGPVAPGKPGAMRAPGGAGAGDRGPGADGGGSGGLAAEGPTAAGLPEGATEAAGRAREGAADSAREAAAARARERQREARDAMGPVVERKPPGHEQPGTGALRELGEEIPGLAPGLPVRGLANPALRGGTAGQRTIRDALPAKLPQGPSHRLTPGAMGGE